MSFFYINRAEKRAEEKITFFAKKVLQYFGISCILITVVTLIAKKREVAA
jgi:hypothetical protein